MTASIALLSPKSGFYRPSIAYSNGLRTGFYPFRTGFPDPPHPPVRWKRPRARIPPGFRPRLRCAALAVETLPIGFP
jgi:hypothetical protein